MTAVKTGVRRDLAEARRLVSRGAAESAEMVYESV